MMLIALTIFAALTLVHVKTPFIMLSVYDEQTKKALVATSTHTAHDNAPGRTTIDLLALKQLRNFLGNIDIS